MTIPWGVFLIRIQEGSHQSLETLFSPYKEWNPDYEHLRPYVEGWVVTGRVRGILCFTCNTAVGKMRDDPALLRRAALYLEGAL